MFHRFAFVNLRHINYEGHALDVQRLHLMYTSYHSCSCDMMLCNLEMTNCIFSVNKMKYKVSHFHADYQAIVFWLPWLFFVNLICLFVWHFTPYRQYFSHITAVEYFSWNFSYDYTKHH